MTFFPGKDDEYGRLVLEGELTLQQVRPLHEELRSSMGNVRKLDVDISGVEEADLSFLQLLCSAHRTAVKTGKTLNLIEDIPEVVRQAMELNGYSGQNNCSLDIGRTCLWAKENLLEVKSK
jgi:ABC-type transporter Mla MlaB component